MCILTSVVVTVTVMCEGGRVSYLFQGGQEGGRAMYRGKEGRSEGRRDVSEAMAGMKIKGEDSDSGEENMLYIHRLSSYI